MIQPDRQVQAKEHIDFLFEQMDKDKNGKLSLSESKTNEHMTLFQGAVHDIPALKKEDVAGPPEDPPTRIDFELFKPAPKDEL